MKHQSFGQHTCNICGTPIAHEEGARGRTAVCKTCASLLERQGPPYTDTTYAVASSPSNSTKKSKASQNEGAAPPASFRLKTTCTCGGSLEFSGRALGMTIACPTCGERIVLTDEMRYEHLKSRRSTPVKKEEWVELMYFPGPPKIQIGELLVDANVVSQTQLEEALSLQVGQGGKLVHNLLLLGYLNSTDFEVFLAGLNGIRSIDLNRCEIDSEVLGLVPLHFALENEVCPIESLGPLLTVGMACPHDAVTLRKVELLTNLKTTAFLCRANDIVRTLKHSHPQRNDPVY